MRAASANGRHKSVQQVVFYDQQVVLLLSKKKVVLYDHVHYVINRAI